MTTRAGKSIRRLALISGTAVLALGALVAPVAAYDRDGSCVARFVEPQAEGSGQQDASFGETVKLFTVVFYPLGQTVSYQALAERDACPFQAPG